MSAWAAFGILAAATAVSGAIAGSSIGESGMLYRRGHAYDLPENPLVRAKRHSSGASEQYVSRTMIVDGRQIGFDPYALEDYEPLEAEYAAIEPVDYLPVDGHSSAPGMRMASADETTQRAEQLAEKVERARARAGGPQVTVMRGTERSIAPVEPIATRIRTSTPASSPAATQSAVIVTDG